MYLISNGVLYQRQILTSLWQYRLWSKERRITALKIIHILSVYCGEEGMFGR